MSIKKLPGKAVDKVWVSVCVWGGLTVVTETRPQRSEPLRTSTRTDAHAQIKVCKAAKLRRQEVVNCSCTVGSLLLNSFSLDCSGDVRFIWGGWIDFFLFMIFSGSLIRQEPSAPTRLCELNRTGRCRCPTPVRKLSNIWKCAEK